MKRLLRAAAAALALLLAIPAARADETTEAKAHYRKGAELYRAHEYREAIDEFEAAYRLKPHGALRYNVAQCHERLEEWPAALAGYVDYLRELPDAKDRAAVRATIGRIEARLAAAGVQALLVYSDPPGAEVRVDGKARGRTPFHTTLPPGTYALALAREGSAPSEQEVKVEARVSTVVEVLLRPAEPVTEAPPPAPAPLSPAVAAAPAAAATAGAKPDLTAHPPAATVPPPAKPPPAQPQARKRVYTWIAAGVAVAAVGAGAAYGVAAQQKERAIDSAAPRPGSEVQRDVNDARSKAHTANVLYGVAAAAGAAGVTLFFLEGTF